MKSFNIRKLVLLIFISLLKITIIFSQNQSSLPNVIPPSPTTTNFMRYGDIPVAYNTGVPSISIPLFTIQQDEITIPISLDYHASGCRVDDVSGVVGLGWSLNAGGMISRTVNGFPDEGEKSFLVPQALAENIDFTQSSNAYMFKHMESGYYDYQYDIYSYNFLGKSGKFIMHGDPTFFIPKTNLKFTSSGVGFIDENGISYYFGQDTSQIEYSDYIDAQTNFNKHCLSTWHLSSIHSRKNPGNFVTFKYQEGPNYTTTRQNSQFILDDWWEDIFNFSSANFPYSIENSGGIKTQTFEMRNRTKFLSEIIFQNGKVKFTINPTTKQLSIIEIFDSNNRILKKINITIEPFPTIKPLTVFSNYKLSTVSILDSTNTILNTYSFDYIAQTSNDAKPNAFDETAGKDYWGYYNGYDNRSNQVTNFPFFTTRGYSSYPWKISIGGDAIKTPNSQYAKMYVLEKIKYPTGGYSLFEYEGNQNALNEVVGGLRVKTIKNYDKNAQKLLEKNYTYESPFQEVSVGYQLFLKSALGEMGTPFTHFRRTIFSENPHVDLSPRGSAVTYSKVTETNGLGKTIFQYDNQSVYQYENLDYPSKNNLTFLGNPPDFYYKKFGNYFRPWNVSNLISKSVYDTSLIESEQTEYEEYIVDTLRELIIDRFRNPDCFVILGCAPDISSYDFTKPLEGESVFNYANKYYLSGGKRIKSSTHTSHSGNKDLVQFKKYKYDNSLYPNMPTSIVSYNSSGDTLITTLKHSYDFNDSMNVLLSSKNIIDPIISQTIFNVSLNKEISKTQTEYRSWYNDSIIQPYKFLKSISGNNLDTEYIINRYDPKGNILEYQSRNGIKTCFLWGYGDRFPVAKIVGLDYDYTLNNVGVNINILETPTSDSALRLELNKLRLLNGAQVNTYTYKPEVGITSETDISGKTIFYEYDNFQRLFCIRDENKKIIKRFCYTVYGQQENCDIDTTSKWIATGNYRCIKNTSNQNTGYQEKEENDTNPYSSLYNQVRWVATGYNTTSCPLPPPPCTLSSASGFSLASYGINSSGNTMSLYLVAYPLTNLYSGYSYLIANITGGCKPTSTQYYSIYTNGKYGQVSINPSGQIYLTMYSTVNAYNAISTGNLTFNF